MSMLAAYGCRGARRPKNAFPGRTATQSGSSPMRRRICKTMRGLSSAAFACLLLFCGSTQAADDISVEATRRDDALEVICRVSLDAPLELVWQTLTDYARLAE